MQLLQLLADDEFRADMMSARGAASQIAVYRGDHPGTSGDDGVGGRAAAKIARCMDQIAEAIGMRITHADGLSSEGRATLNAYFLIPDTEATLMVGYCSDKPPAFQIIHDNEVAIEHSSHIDLAAAACEPMALLEEHFAPEEERRELRNLLTRLRLQPVPPSGEKLTYSAWFLNLAPAP